MNAIKILLIGSDDSNLSMMRSILLKYDNEWLITKKTFEGHIEELNRAKYNLVLIDNHEELPKLFRIVYDIKQTKLNYNSPILVSLEEDENLDIKEILETGVLDCIYRPLKDIDLFARVRTGLTLSSTLNKLELQATTISENENKIREVISGLIPDEIIKELTLYGESKPKKYIEASVIFVDMVDFTRKSTKLSPKVLISELSQIFAGFDKLIKKHDCTRIKTMGDGYLAVSGIPKPNAEHAQKAIDLAVDIRIFLSERNAINDVKWDARIGINSGEVIGSVLGNGNFLFDVFGETVNEASRMEKSCEPNQINVSKSTYLLTRAKNKFVHRLPNDVKGLGKKNMYYFKKK